MCISEKCSKHQDFLVAKDVLYSLGHFVTQSFCTFSRKRFYSPNCTSVCLFTLYNVHATITLLRSILATYNLFLHLNCNTETTELCHLRDISALSMSGNFPLDAKRRCRKTTTDKQELKHKNFDEFEICLLVMYVLFSIVNFSNLTQYKPSKRFLILSTSILCYS
jgi:hypothetical protein